MFIPVDNVQWGWNLTWKPKKASTALSYGAILATDGSGHAQAATATSHTFIGICLAKIAATDTDYAANTAIPILDLQTTGRDQLVVATTTSGGTVANEGVAYDLSDSLTVNLAASAVKAFLYTKCLTGTLAQGRILNPTLL